MYDWPEVHDRTDAFWQATAAFLKVEGIDVPEVLDRPLEISAPWSRPDLLLGQTCGLPYVMGRCGDAGLVARPDYGLPGASGGEYCSAIICRRDESGDLSSFRGRIAAVNEYGSQSGCNALAAEVHGLGLVGEPFFGEVRLSGAHRKSATLVADGMCDIAAIDAVGWALFQELESERAETLRVLRWTQKTPALPFISAFPEHAEGLRRALTQAAQSRQFGAGIPVSIESAVDADYDAIRNMACACRRHTSCASGRTSPYFTRCINLIVITVAH